MKQPVYYAPLRVSGGSCELTRPGWALCSGKSIWGPDRRGHSPGCSAPGVDVAPSLPLRRGATHFGGPPGERPPFEVCLSRGSFARPLIYTLRDMGPEEFPGGGGNVRSPERELGALDLGRAFPLSGGPGPGEGPGCICYNDLHCYTGFIVFYNI